VSGPSAAEQHRIVDLLSRAENIVRMRRRRSRGQGDYSGAVSGYVWGSGTNPKGGRNLHSGKSLLSFAMVRRRNHLLMETRAAHPQRRWRNVDIRDLKFLNASDSDRGRYSLMSGDILFVRTNGNPDYVGRCAVFEPPTIGVGYTRRILFAVGRCRTLWTRNSCRSSCHPSKVGVASRARTYGGGQYNINVPAAKHTIVLPPLDRNTCLRHSFAELESYRLVQPPLDGR